MKLATEQRESQVSSNTKATRFGIANTSHAFSILSSSLYTDKPLAIVRELACNAYDSHVAAGKKDVPVTIHLPTVLEPTFYVEDNGVGLTDLQVRGDEAKGIDGLYNMYFASSKRKTDNEIGCLGLGCKSPFAYASSFILESRKDGVLRTYSMFKDEENIPAVALMNESPTDKENGLKVSFAVNKNDVHLFINAARRALMYFDPLPKMLGVRDFRPYDYKYTLTGPNWKLRVISDWDARIRGPHVVQGFVSYPIKTQLIYGVDRDDVGADAELANSLGSLDIDVFVPIGKVDFAPSREQLEYNKRTIESLKDSFSTLETEFRASAEKKIADSKTLWDACMMFQTVTSSNNHQFNNLMTACHKANPFTWRGKVVDNTIVVDMKKLRSTEIELYVKNHKGSKRSTGLIRQDGTVILHPRSDTKVVVDNVGGFKGADLTRQYCNDVGKVYVVKPLSMEAVNQKEIDSVFVMMGSPAVKKVSELNYTTKKSTTGYRYKNRDLAMMWKGFSRDKRDRVRDTFSRLCWENDVKVDFEQGGFYLPIRKFTVYFDGKVKPGTEVFGLDTILDTALKLKLLNDADVKSTYGLTTKQIAVAKRDGEWSNLFDVIKERFAKRKDEFVDSLIADSMTDTVQHDGDYPYALLKHWDRIITDYKVKDCSFKKHVDQVTKLYKMNITKKGVGADVRRLTGSMSDFNHYHTQIETSIKQLTGEWKTLTKEYEMLQFFDWNRVNLGDDYIQNILVKYINLVASGKSNG